MKAFRNLLALESTPLVSFTVGLKDPFSEQHLLCWITDALAKKA